jgi:hypothetical protein
LMKGQDRFSYPFNTQDTHGVKGSGIVSLAKSEHDINNSRQEKTL